MNNRELAKIFNDMARYLAMDEVAFKPQAYERAAYSLESLNEDIAQVYQRGGIKGLQEIPGIGKSIAGHIEEYLKKGKIREYEKFRQRLPLNMDELARVEGLGPKKIKALYRQLGVRDIKSLEKAVKNHQVASLGGFGKTTEDNIIQALEFLKRDKGRFLIGDILPVARGVLDQLKKLPEVEKADIAGSLRRRRETIGDVDFLVVSKSPKKVMDFFCSSPGIEKIWGKGGTKASVRMVNGFDMDLRVVPKKSYGAAMQYFTGSKEHNIATRRIAIEKGLKLSEYGLFRGKEMIASENEEDVYRALGMAWVPPEIRENGGEIEASLRHALPKLVELKDIKGDLHCHSNWNGGKYSIEEMAQAAISLGYQYIGISDHTKTLHIERGLNEKQLAEQRKEIHQLNEKFRSRNVPFTILQGCEANIMRTGSIDIDDEALAKLDYVIAGIHSLHKMPKEGMMARMEKAMRNPHVDIISHPTGRLIGKRDEYAHDFGNMLQLAKETDTILEINSSPHRLDLRDTNIRKAKQAGVKMIINTDSHQKEQLHLMEYGVSQARRGWAGKEDIINTLPVEKLLEYF